MLHPTSTRWHWLVFKFCVCTQESLLLSNFVLKVGKSRSWQNLNPGWFATSLLSPTSSDAGFRYMVSLSQLKHLPWQLLDSLVEDAYPGTQLGRQILVFVDKLFEKNMRKRQWLVHANCLVRCTWFHLNILCWYSGLGNLRLYNCTFNSFGIRLLVLKWNCFANIGS